MKEKESRGEIVLYQAPDGQTTLEVKLEGDSVWLAQGQIAKLFGVNVPAVSKHIKNIFAAGELVPKATVSKMEIVRKEGKRRVARLVDLYNLDMIISVGYRVNSARATRFRIWATQVLRQHLIQGYTLNERRLKERGIEFEQAVRLLSKTLTRHDLVNEQGRGILEVITRYAKSWSLLKRYDERRIALPEKRHPARIAMDYGKAKEAAAVLRKELSGKREASDLFGHERGQAFPAILGAIEQTFDGKPLYPSVEEKAAHLLYFVIKDHPFTDGNKRIGSFLFIIYLRENGCLEDATGRVKLNDNALVALALLIAESEPAQKELMVRLVMNLLADNI